MVLPSAEGDEGNRPGLGGDPRSGPVILGYSQLADREGCVTDAGSPGFSSAPAPLP